MKYIHEYMFEFFAPVRLLLIILHRKSTAKMVVIPVMERLIPDLLCNFL